MRDLEEMFSPPPPVAPDNAAAADSLDMTK
jgi:hypothetical protein